MNIKSNIDIIFLDRNTKYSNILVWVEKSLELMNVLLLIISGDHMECGEKQPRITE